MAVMMGNLYAALVKAGAGESEAQRAAEEIAGYENRFSKIDSDINLLKWMVGFNLAMTMLLLGSCSSSRIDRERVVMNESAADIASNGLAETTSLPKEEIDRLTDEIVAALKTVFDPEIPADIYELGLIYRVDIADDRKVAIDMTLTAPACPVAGEMPIWVENAVAAVPGVQDVVVNMVFDPPWDQSRMSDEARVALDMW